MARRRIKDGNGNYIWFDTDQEYYEYLQMIRNSWPNRIKRFFNKVLAVIIAIIVVVSIIGYCAREKEKVSTEKSKVESNENHSETKRKDEVRTANIDNQEKAESQEVTEKENQTNEEVSEERQTEESKNEENIENTLQEESVKIEEAE